MAFPTVVTSTESLVTANTTSHTVDLPTGIQAGDLLIVIFSSDGSPTITFPNEGTDWISLLEQNPADVAVEAAYRDADGTEGASITVTTSVSERSSAVAYRITGHEDPATQAPEVSTGATGTNNAPDADSLTPTGGAKDYLWIAYHGIDDAPGFTSYPTNYDDNQQEITHSSGLGASTAIASRELTASSEDPGIYARAASDAWAAATIAVHPAPSAEPPGGGIESGLEAMSVTEGGDLLL